MKLEADGLHKGRGVKGAKEEDIYRSLGLPFIEPELREGRGEIERALKGNLPKLVTDNDLRGILHCHTDASDGTETLETMAKATRERGFDYFGVADHSKSAHYAGGLSLEQIGEQHREADRLNRSFGKEFRILKGIESDILADGSLDYPDDVLESFDFVVASIHGRFKLDRKAQTDRLLRAVSNPHTTILGHMTGRQLQRRPGYDIDVEKVLRACARHGVAVEINAHPWRLDLDWRWHQAALDFGCMMSINPDAHSIRELDHMHWGVEMARKGGVPADRVLNAMTLTQIHATSEAPPARAGAGCLRCLNSFSKAPWWPSRPTAVTISASRCAPASLSSRDTAPKAMLTLARPSDIDILPGGGLIFPTCVRCTCCQANSSMTCVLRATTCILESSARMSPRRGWTLNGCPWEPF